MQAERPPIQAVTGQLMAKLFQIINAHVFMRPSPVLQISTGATQNNLGQYAYALSGIDRDQVDAAAMKLQAAMQSRPICSPPSHPICSTILRIFRSIFCVTPLPATAFPPRRLKAPSARPIRRITFI